MLVDNPARRNLLALVACDKQLSFGDHRRGHVQYYRISAGDRDADGNRIGRESAVAAAKWRHTLRT